MTRSRPSSCKFGVSSWGQHVFRLHIATATHLKHRLDTTVADLLTGGDDLLTALVAEGSLNELLAVLDQQVVDRLVTDRGDLDELCETVSDLTSWQSLEQGEVEEGVDGGVVGSETGVRPSYLRGKSPRLPVLQLAVVDSDLDGDGSVDETDEGGGDSDKVG